MAQQLTARYGKGFSATNLGYFRQFYLAYRDRIPHPPGGESQPEGAPKTIPHDMLRGKIDKFSLDALVNMLAKAGMRVEMRVKKAA